MIRSNMLHVKTFGTPLWSLSLEQILTGFSCTDRYCAGSPIAEKSRFWNVAGCLYAQGADASILGTSSRIHGRILPNFPIRPSRLSHMHFWGIPSYAMLTSLPPAFAIYKLGEILSPISCMFPAAANDSDKPGRFCTANRIQIRNGFI